jgi:hypothetical protein
MTGDTKTSRFKGIHPVMIYVFKENLEEIRAYAKKQKVSLSQIAREGLSMRMAQGDLYMQGLNDGLDVGMNAIRESNWAQMIFPSGRTFADLICDELERKKHGLSGKGKRKAKDTERDPEGDSLAPEEKC